MIVTFALVALAVTSGTMLIWSTDSDSQRIAKRNLNDRLINRRRK